MSSLRMYVAAGIAIIAFAGCGGEASSGSQPSTVPSSATVAAAPTPSPTPTFDVVAWRFKWDSARGGYASALGAFGNQIKYLREHKATDAQIASVLPGMARRVTTAATGFIGALDKAGAVSADRADVKTAAAKLRGALVAQHAAYARLAACSTKNYACQMNTFSGISSTSGLVAAATNAVPTT